MNQIYFGLVAYCLGSYILTIAKINQIFTSP